jgi:hypothetical protein
MKYRLQAAMERTAERPQQQIDKEELTKRAATGSIQISELSQSQRLKA